MKKLLTTLALMIATAVVGQTYSNFYGVYDVNQNINSNSNVNVSGTINKNVNVSGTVNQNINKTVKTIDYGALAAANAQQEANRLNALQYADARDAARAVQIAADPFAAFTYGNKLEQTFYKSQSRKYLTDYGHAGKRVYWTFTEPNHLLFSKTAWGNYRNTDVSGNIICEIELNMVYNFSYANETYPDRYPDSLRTARAKADWVVNRKIGDIVQGDDGPMFTHKTELGIATVYGHKGYRATWIYETDFEYIIKDNYFSTNNGIFYECGIRYRIDKTRGSFEDLEGRRYYLRRLGEEVIATANLNYF